VTTAAAPRVMVPAWDDDQASANVVVRVPVAVPERPEAKTRSWTPLLREVRAARVRLVGRLVQAGGVGSSGREAFAWWCRPAMAPLLARLVREPASVRVLVAVAESLD